LRASAARFERRSAVAGSVIGNPGRRGRAAGEPGMKPSLTVGIEKTASITVDEARTIDFMGDECRVYATPQMIGDIERFCRDFLLEHLDPGEDSVGAHIELDHLAPTPAGMTVEIMAKVAEIKGRLVTFEVSARDSVEQVAHGMHMRFVVNVEATADRIKRKRAKVQGAAR
jgi:fluoroacetyl-CoA thioesterase